MDKNEAGEIVRRELDTYRQQSFTKLTELVGEQVVVEPTVASGAEYQIKVKPFGMTLNSWAAICA